MKLVAYRVNGRDHIGVVRDGDIAEIGPALGAQSLRQVLELGPHALEVAGQIDAATHRLDEVELLPPIDAPHHLYCVGVNYEDHLREVQEAGVVRPRPQHPSLFIRFPETMVGHGEPMLLPKVSDKLDYEAELAIIIGEGGRYIDENRAFDYVAGYSCFNDGSVRDWQYHSSQVTSGKNFIGTGAFGPWIVTADEIQDPSNLDIKLSLNEKVLQHSNTNALIFNIPRIVSYASALVPLKPGDVIATGTPAGVGFSRNPPIFMKEGDVCEVTIEGIGTLRNPIRKAAS